MNAKIGVIGGSGLYSLFEGEIKTMDVITPFGKPSDDITIGSISGQKAAFLPRHGKKHTILPSEINYQANIYAMKKLGIEKIISISAVGSLREDFKPRDVVIVDQFFDRTNKRPNTFFGEGFTAHVSFGDPVCPAMRKQIFETSKRMTGTFHTKGTYVNMEGPQFSTRAESKFYKSMGFDIIGMTNLSEARLAREAEICYATLAFVTDYDCWREQDESVTTDEIIRVLHDNALNAKKIIAEVIKDLNSGKHECTCRDALKHAMITPASSIPDKTKNRLHEILHKYY